MKHIKRLALGLLLLCCDTTLSAQSAQKTMTLTSSAFKDGNRIPLRYTCDGDDVSPPLEWTGVPEGTKSFALICDDPDAPTKKPWVHWIIFNIPADMTALDAGISPTKEPMKTIKQGKTTWEKDSKKQIGYHGPCPPSGEHRYFFKIYALDTLLNLGAGVPREKLEAAMKGHILASGQLMGTYVRVDSSS